MVSEQQLPYLIQLLDDNDPATQEALKAAFADSSGDISNEIAALGIDLTPKDKLKLSTLLLPARRANLIAEWQIPHGKAASISEDWDSFEHHLRIISDYLHDGISLRASVSDNIDIITQEVTEELDEINADKLRIWLFKAGRYKGNKNHFYSPHNSDLSWVIDNGLGNPLSLATLYMLIAHRLNLDVSGCNYPGHFLARIFLDGEAQLVDCFHRGKLIRSKSVLEKHKEISLAAKMAIKVDTPLGHILWRFLRNLEYGFSKLNLKEDEKLFSDLAKSLH